MSTMTGLPPKLEWTPQPAAEAVVRSVTGAVTGALPVARHLADRLLAEAGVRFADVIDTIYLSAQAPLLADAMDAGWQKVGDEEGWQLYRNADGVFPLIATGGRTPEPNIGIDLK